MIKTVIKHKLAELAINNLFDKLIQNFQKPSEEPKKYRYVKVIWESDTTVYELNFFDCYIYAIVEDAYDYIIKYDLCYAMTHPIGTSYTNNDKYEKLTNGEYTCCLDEIVSSQ